MLLGGIGSDLSGNLFVSGYLTDKESADNTEIPKEEKSWKKFLSKISPDGEQEWTSSYDSLGDFPQYQYGNSFSSYSDRGFFNNPTSSVEVTSNG